MARHFAGLRRTQCGDPHRRPEAGNLRVPGGDIVTYLKAAREAGRRLTLAENWRSDKVLVDTLHTVLQGAALGDEDIVVHPIEAFNLGHRLTGAPRNAPFRLRVVARTEFGTPQRKTIPITVLRPYIAKDLAADISVLLAGGARFDDRPSPPGTSQSSSTGHEMPNRAGTPCWKSVFR